MKPALSSHIIINGEIFTEILDKDINNVKSGQYINGSGVIYTPNSIYKFRYPVYGSNRYGRVRVYKNDGSCIMTTVHRLLMTVYIPIDNRDELVVNHINGNKHYNSLMNNLEWVTEKENAKHYVEKINNSTEKALENKIKDYLFERGHLYFKVHGSKFMTPGISDLICCICGVFVAMEIKAPGKKNTESEQQKVFGSNVIKSNGLYYLIDNFEDAVEIITGIEKTHQIDIKGDKE